MLFQAVMKMLSRLVEFKILINMGLNNLLSSSIIKSTNHVMATRKEISQANVEDQDNVEMDDENSAIDLQDLVNAEHVEIIIGCLEEVHKVLINAYELLVSVRFKWMPPYNCKETAAKNKVFTMPQNICHLCEMGIF
jgi:hypothetical protein